MKTILIISEKKNHEVKAITAFLPARSWFHLVLDVIHSRYKIFTNVAEGSFSIEDNATKQIVYSHQLKSIWVPRMDFMYEEGFRNKDKLAKFFASEYYSLIDGLIACAERSSCLIVTHPDATFRAGNKVRQQLVASQLGMKLPAQIITNRKEFFLQQTWHKRAIFKPIHSSNLHHDPIENQMYMSKPVIITNILLQKIKKNKVDLTVHYFQEQLKFIAEYRVVVFGDKVYPFKITGNYEIDWRNYLPRIKIAYQKKFIYTRECLAYNAYFNLTLGCFDFIETKDGMFFIECNPPGYIQFCDPDNKAGMLVAFANYLKTGGNESTGN